MRLTRGERRRLQRLRAWHRRPPTWAALLPKGIAIVVVYCALIIGYAIVAAGAGSPLIYYCLGLATFFPLLALNLIVTTIRRWRINEAIIDWARVDQLLLTVDRADI